jgi:hypothetical protein
LPCAHPARIRHGLEIDFRSDPTHPSHRSVSALSKEAKVAKELTSPNAAKIAAEAESLLNEISDKILAAHKKTPRERLIEMTMPASSQPVPAFS